MVKTPSCEHHMSNEACRDFLCIKRVALLRLFNLFLFYVQFWIALIYPIDFSKVKKKKVQNIYWQHCNFFWKYFFPCSFQLFNCSISIKAPKKTHCMQCPEIHVTVTRTISAVTVLHFLFHIFLNSYTYPALFDHLMKDYLNESSNTFTSMMKRLKHTRRQKKTELQNINHKNLQYLPCRLDATETKAKQQNVWKRLHVHVNYF